MSTHILEMFNIAGAAVVAAIAGWAVMSPRVRLGLLMHLGLTLVSVGFLGLVLITLGPYASRSAIAAGNAFVNVGLIFCAAGYLQRARKRGHQRRASDWVERR